MLCILQVQHTPYPWAQLPSLVPPFWEHSSLDWFNWLYIFNLLKKETNLLGITSSIPCSSITWIIGKGYNIEEWYWNRIRVLKDLFQKCFYDLQTFPSLVWLETKMTKEMKTKIVFIMLLRVLRFDSKWWWTSQLLGFLNGENRVSLAL